MCLSPLSLKVSLSMCLSPLSLKVSLSMCLSPLSLKVSLSMCLSPLSLSVSLALSNSSLKIVLSLSYSLSNSLRLSVSLSISLSLYLSPPLSLSPISLSYLNYLPPSSTMFLYRPHLLSSPFISFPSFTDWGNYGFLLSNSTTDFPTLCLGYEHYYCCTPVFIVQLTITSPFIGEPPTRRLPSASVCWDKAF